MMTYNIYTKANSAIVPATTWAILSFFMPSYLRNAFDINIFIFVGIVFIMAYGVFWLARYFSYSMWELPILVLGIVSLWII